MSSSDCVRLLSALSVLVSLSPGCGGESGDASGGGGGAGSGGSDAGAGRCEGEPRSCSVLTACASGYERIEYETGCCACRSTHCSATSCKPDATCRPDEHAVFVADACCPVCVPNDSKCGRDEAPCATLECPSGYRPVTSQTPDCCAACEVDPNHCADEAQAYSVFLAGELSSQKAQACAVDSDCTVAMLKSACKGDCGTPITKSAQASMEAAVAEYGAKHCANCPPARATCPAVSLVAKCESQKCVLSPGA